MLLGWICIGCQEAIEAKTPPWASRPVPPDRCPSCGDGVFQRIERITEAEGLYPDRKPEETITDGNSLSFWEDNVAPPKYGTGIDQDCDTVVEKLCNFDPIIYKADYFTRLFPGTRPATDWHLPSESSE